MIRVVLVVVVVCVLAGCTTESIYLKDPKTGVIASCGGHPLAFPIYATVAATHDQECVQNYREQGYLRVPGPQ